jgi:hypothetical protein
MKPLSFQEGSIQPRIVQFATGMEAAIQSVTKSTQEYQAANHFSTIFVSLLTIKLEG